jgi:hypothetical protein
MHFFEFPQVGMNAQQSAEQNGHKAVAQYLASIRR